MRLHANNLYGTVVRSRLVGGFTLTETAYSSGLQLPRHAHHSAYFCFVLQGHFTEFHDKQSRACRASTLIFHPSGEPHADHFHSAARCFNLLMDIKWVENIRQASMILATPTAFQGGLVAQLTTKLYREFRQIDELSPLIIEGLTTELLGEATRGSLRFQRPTVPPWLNRARELLHDQFRERLTLSKVAASVGVHETHLCREFRRYFRCTVGEYTRQLRIEFACHQLCGSTNPLSEIALAAGFTDQSHFARTFKQITGLSPASYRRTFRSH